MSDKIFKLCPNFMNYSVIITDSSKRVFTMYIHILQPDRCHNNDICWIQKANIYMQIYSSLPAVSTA